MLNAGRRGKNLMRHWYRVPFGLLRGGDVGVCCGYCRYSSAPYNRWRFPLLFALGTAFLLLLQVLEAFAPQARFDILLSYCMVCAGVWREGQRCLACFGLSPTLLCFVRFLRLFSCIPNYLYGIQSRGMFSLPTPSRFTKCTEAIYSCDVRGGALATSKAVGPEGSACSVNRSRYVLMHAAGNCLKCGMRDQRCPMLRERGAAHA